VQANFRRPPAASSPDLPFITPMRSDGGVISLFHLNFWLFLLTARGLDFSVHFSFLLVQDHDNQTSCGEG
jgi:hypothetical protein